MKTMLAILTLTSSLSAFAAKDPAHCGKQDTCTKDSIFLLKSGTHYARGYGRSCAEAKRESEEAFILKFGNIECGLFSGPTAECYKDTNGVTVSWSQCNPDSGPMRSRNTGCANVGGQLICN